jgi:hypothetical protein
VAGEILQRTLSTAYRKADYFTRNVRTIQVLIDRESILTGTAASGEQPWKYYDLGDGYCSYDFFAKCPHRLACAKCSFYLPKQSNAGQLVAVKDGIDQMLAQLDLTDDERAALEGDREALAALANRLADVATPSGPTPNELGNGTAFIPLTALRASLREALRDETAAHRILGAPCSRTRRTALGVFFALQPGPLRVHGRSAKSDRQ